MQKFHCRACDSQDVELLMELGPQPSAGGFLAPGTDDLRNEVKHPLPIHACRTCGLVQTFYVIPLDKLFSQYYFASSTISSLIEHFRNHASWLKESFNPGLVVEIGSNDGVLLEPLRAIGVVACGVDISENMTKISRAKGLSVVNGFFDDDAVAEIVGKYGRADVLTGSNCFPHNDRPDIILKAARNLLKDDGHIVLEFMYAGEILKSLQWDSMYHEHLNYFCLHTIDTLLRRFGFHVVDATLLPMHAGSMRITAAIDANEQPKPSVIKFLEDEQTQGLNDIKVWREFSQRVKNRIEVVRKTLKSLSHEHSIWAYGASGRASMWVNACAMDYLKAVVDSSPYRCGRLMPGTHTPIVYPEELRRNPPDYIIVLAWNYFDHIRKKESWYRGHWITPLPDFSIY